METVIETTNLTKRYGKNRGIEDVNISVARGDVFGFLGPNGAGKSTTIRTLMDFIRPTGGSAAIFGMDCHRDSVAIHRKISYVPGDVSLYGHMTGEKLIRYFSNVRGKYDRPAVEGFAKRFDIRLDRRIREYSKGNRQKVALIQAFACNPDLIIMDEPTSGLDPLVQKIFLDVLQEEARDGRTIFMSSHVLSEVEKACNRVAIIREGRIVALEDKKALMQKAGQVVEVSFARAVTTDQLRIPGVSGVVAQNGHYRMTVSSGIGHVIREIADYDIVDISVHPMTMDDIFMQYYAGGMTHGS